MCYEPRCLRPVLVGCPVKYVGRAEGWGNALSRQGPRNGSTNQDSDPLLFESDSTSAACAEVREKLTRLGVPSSKKPTVVYAACGISTTDNGLTREKLVHFSYATAGLNFACS